MNVFITRNIILKHIQIVYYVKIINGILCFKKLTNYTTNDFLDI